MFPRFRAARPSGLWAAEREIGHARLQSPYALHEQRNDRAVVDGQAVAAVRDLGHRFGKNGLYLLGE